MEDVLKALVATGCYAQCCRCGAVEVPCKGTLDEPEWAAYAQEVRTDRRKLQRYPATAEAKEDYAMQLRKAGWHISKFHPTEASFCPRCWAIEERFL